MGKTKPTLESGAVLLMRTFTQKERAFIALSKAEREMNRPLTAGQRAADFISSYMGSWNFIAGQSIALTVWILWNTLAPVHLRWDSYPFVFLNLMLSFEAAYSAPFIMMSQNRQSQIDRTRDIADFEINKENEGEVEQIEKAVSYTDKLLEQILVDNQKIKESLGID